MYDLLIKNACVIDGTGNPRFYSDVAITNGTIEKIARVIPGESKKTIDATGFVLSPGFIDSHGHTDMVFDVDKTLSGKLEQGVTTEICGMCGMSAAPLSMEYLEDGLRSVNALTKEYFCRDLKRRSRFSDYLEELNQASFGANVGLHVGHGTLRAAVMGYHTDQPTALEMEKMESLLVDAMEGGALGISFGLIYPPGAYANIEEMSRLCGVVADYSGTFTIHMRSESAKLVEAVRETLAIVRNTGVRCVISHHKAIGKANWGKTKDTLALIEEANQEGFEVFCDQYPYIASATGLNTCIPAEMHALGFDALMELLSSASGRETLRPLVLEGKDEETRFGYMMIGNSNAHPEYTGKMLCKLATEQGKKPSDFLFDLLRDDQLSSGGIYFTMEEADVERVMKYERTMLGTDGLVGVPGEKISHPRATASFPRFLGRYIRQQGVLSLETAIRKITSLPAMVYGLDGKGLIRKGMDADLVLFDPETILDHADFSDASKRCSGVKHVLIRGNIVVTDSVYNGGQYGKLLLKSF